MDWEFGISRCKLLQLEWVNNKILLAVPVVAQWVKIPTSIHDVAGSIPGFTQWVKDPALLWLWCRPAAVALIRPLAWEAPYATGAALKKKSFPYQ